MKKHKRYTSICALFMLTAGLAMAQENRIVTNSKLLGVGKTNILDTYLSPEKYNGTELRYISHTLREQQGKRLYREVIHQGQVAYADNRAGNGSEMAGMYNFQYGWHYRLLSLEDGKLTLGMGGNLDANLGFIYNTRNSNNPAQARLYLNITPVVEAAYRFRVRNNPHTLRYELAVPLLGVMFSPNYGQSYYEIFSQGDYDHNVVPTWIGNAPSLRQLLTIDITLWNTTFRVGYLGDFQQAKVNGLRTHVYTNSLVVGISRRFQLIKMRP